MSRDTHECFPSRGFMWWICPHSSGYGRASGPFPAPPTPLVTEGEYSHLLLQCAFPPGPSNFNYNLQGFINSKSKVVTTAHFYSGNTNTNKKITWASSTCDDLRCIPLTVYRTLTWTLTCITWWRWAGTASFHQHFRCLEDSIILELYL